FSRDWSSDVCSSDLDPVPVHRLAGAVGDQDDQAVVRDPGQHPLDHAPGLVHARHDHHQVAFDRAQGILGDGDGRAQPPPGHRAVPAVELDDPLDLVDPDGAETLCAVRSLQTHAATVPPLPGGPATAVWQVIGGYFRQTL